MGTSWIASAAASIALFFAISPARAQESEKSGGDTDAPIGEAQRDSEPKQPVAKKKKKKLATVPFRDASPPASAFPPKRPVPDYDGRGPEETTASDVLLWIPRVVASPFYFVSEFVIRRPIVALLTGIEYDRLAQKAFYIFSFAGKQHIGLVPTAFVDFGFLPSVGFYFFWDDALHPKNHVRVHFGTWGIDWLHVAVTDRWDVGEHSTAALRASFTKRSDRLYYGIGPDAPESNESRYASTIVDAGPTFDLRATPSLQLHTAAGLRRGIFGADTCCDSPSTYDRIVRGELEAPPRFFDGYGIGYQSAELVYDSRDPKTESLTGVRVAASAQPAFDLSRRPGTSWLRYDATAGAFWDITGQARVLSLSLATQLADPMTGSGSDIPFNEQIVLGGDGLMRGFLAGRLVGRSAAVATLLYEYPIWAFVNGTVQASAGNVFGAGLQGFDAKKLRLSTGFGLRTNSSPDNKFELLVGFGTDTFENGASITSVRLALGATNGF